MGGDSQLFFFFSVEMGQRAGIRSLCAFTAACQCFWLFRANRRGSLLRTSWGKLKREQRMKQGATRLLRRHKIVLGGLSSCV